MFKFLFVLLSVCTCAWGAALPSGVLPQLDGRIVGGEPTTIARHPWQVSIQRSGAHSCGGSIYSERYIVTAAHCLQNSVSVSILKVHAGSSYWTSGGALLSVESYLTHEGYNGATMVNDIAIIRLSASLKFSSTIKTIEIAEVAPTSGSPAVVTGWGTTQSGGGSLPVQLQEVHLNIIGRSDCASSSYLYGNKIKNSMICAGTKGKDSCQGDSGGPLVSGGHLVGVVSWGEGCAFEGFPGVYANAATLRPWIIEHAQ